MVFLHAHSWVAAPTSCMQVGKLRASWQEGPASERAQHFRKGFTNFLTLQSWSASGRRVHPAMTDWELTLQLRCAALGVAADARCQSIHTPRALAGRASAIESRGFLSAIESKLPWPMPVDFAGLSLKSCFVNGHKLLASQTFWPKGWPMSRRADGG